MRSGRVGGAVSYGSMPDAAATWSPAPISCPPRRHALPRRPLVRRRSTRRTATCSKPHGERRAGGRGRRRRRADRGSRPPRPVVDRAAGRGAARLGARCGPRCRPSALHLVTLAAARSPRSRRSRELGGIDAGSSGRTTWWSTTASSPGILAEADGAGAVVVGMGCNVRGDLFPAELATIATACDRCTDRAITREQLLVRVAAWRSTRGSTRSTAWSTTRSPQFRDARPARAGRARRTRAYEADAVRSTAEGYLVVRRPTTERRATSISVGRRDPPAHAGLGIEVARDERR